MSDDGIMWDHYRIEQKMRRRQRLPVRTATIMELRDEGYSVKQMTEFQFRVKGRLDIYPIHHRYHDIKTGERGGFKYIKDFVREYFYKIAMEKHTHLIVGYGEVGKGLHGVITNAQVYDPFQGIANFSNNEAPDVMHICYPYFKDEDARFRTSIVEYQNKFNPKITIVHSTVPIGTCDALGVVHSPIRGVHPELTKGIQTFTKYFGGKQSYEAAMIFAELGIGVMHFDKASITEAIKLWDTTQYGWMIILEKMIYDWCKANGFSDKEAWDIYGQANYDYNVGYARLGRKDVQRPFLKHMEGVIGGHCVIPNLELLNSEICGIIKELNKRYDKAEASKKEGE